MERKQINFRLEHMTKQKVRAKWFEKVDINTKYFNRLII